MNYTPKIEYIELNTATPKSITFSSPPEGDPLKEEYKTSSTVTRSNNGMKQYAFNNTRKEYEVQFLFQSETTKDAMVDFMTNHAMKGGKFDYFIHSDEVASEEMTLEGKDFALARPIPSGVIGQFEYDFEFKMSRVI